MKTEKLRRILQDYIENVNDSDAITEGLEQVINELEAGEGLQASPKQETFLDRLQKERDELSDKLVKLEAFISNKEKAIQISGQAQYDLLLKQSHFMNEYLNILDHRLVLLQID
jgi:hypothetical protein